MAATQTLDAKAQKSDGLNGHVFAPEMETNNNAPLKRNGRKPKKEVDELTKAASFAEVLLSPATPDSATIPTAGSSELLPQSTAEASTPVSVPISIVEADPQPNECTPPEDLAQSSSTKQGQSNGSAATVTLTPVVIAKYSHEAKVRFFQDQHGNVFA